MNIDEAVDALEFCLIKSFDLLKLDDTVGGLVAQKNLIALEGIRDTYLEQLDMAKKVELAFQNLLTTSTDAKENEMLKSYMRSAGLLQQGHENLLKNVDEALAHVRKILTSIHGSN